VRGSGREGVKEKDKKDVEQRKIEAEKERWK